jgi:hypothetical protein
VEEEEKIMAFTKTHAKILAGMLPPDQLIAFTFICGKASDSKAYATPEVLDDLIALELVRRDSDGKRDLVLLTPKGKKVAEFV